MVFIRKFFHKNVADINHICSADKHSEFLRNGRMRRAREAGSSSNEYLEKKMKQLGDSDTVQPGAEDLSAIEKEISELKSKKHG